LENPINEVTAMYNYKRINFEIIFWVIVLFPFVPIMSCNESQKIYTVDDAYNKMAELCQMQEECEGSEASGNCIELFSEYIKPNEENQSCIDIVTEWLTCLTENASCIENTLSVGVDCDSLEEKADDCED
jgi:hypothetical protein